MARGTEDGCANLKGLSNKINAYPRSFRCGLISFVPQGGTCSRYLRTDDRASR